LDQSEPEVTPGRVVPAALPKISPPEPNKQLVTPAPKPEETRDRDTDSAEKQTLSSSPPGKTGEPAAGQLSKEIAAKPSKSKKKPPKNPPTDASAKTGPTKTPDQKDGKEDEVKGRFGTTFVPVED
jgi:hypothetical protein